MPEPDTLLRAYLDGHDADCPRCGYALRGNRDGACPECGLELRLGLLGGDALRHVRGFVLLAFGWLAAAGVMNTARNFRALADNRQYVMSGAQFGGGGIGIMPAPVSGSMRRTSIIESWIAMDWDRQFSTVWALGLAAGAIAGLVWYVRLARRGATRERARSIARLATVLFAVYAAWHAVMFTREVVLP